MPSGSSSTKVKQHFVDEAIGWQANTAGAGKVEIAAVSSGVVVPISGTISATISGTINVSVVNTAGDAVPVSFSGNATVVQATHDNLNANANIQVGNVDVGSGNKVPVSGAVTATISGNVSVINANTVGNLVNAKVVEVGSVVDTGNSTTTPLSGGGNFTGTWKSLLGFSQIAVTINADADSATDGMKFQFSTDGTNVDDTYSFNFTADDSRRFQFPVTAQYFRVNFTSTAGAPGNQTFFRLQTILHTANILTSIHRLDADVDPDRSAELVKAGLIAQVAGSGDFIPIQANAGGILKVGGDVGIDDGATIIITNGTFDVNIIGGTTNQDIRIAAVAVGTTALPVDANINATWVGTVLADTNSSATDTLVASPGSSTAIQVRGFSVCNAGASVRQVSLRFGATFFWTGALAADGGAFNWNMIGHYPQSADNKSLIAYMGDSGTVIFSAAYKTA